MITYFTYKELDCDLEKIGLFNYLLLFFCFIADLLFIPVYLIFYLPFALYLKHIDKKVKEERN